MAHSFVNLLPDELLEAIVIYLDPKSTISFGLSSRKANQITHEAVVWRRHCLRDWKYWHPRHEIAEKTAQPPAQTKWKRLYQERQTIDKLAAAKFQSILQTQQSRIHKIEELCALSYDVKDLMLKFSSREEAARQDDELARRFFSKTILEKIHREIAINTWDRLQHRQMVSLEQALGSYDLFATAGEPGDLKWLEETLDQLKEGVEEQYEDFHQLSTRQKALNIASFLRRNELLGNPNAGSYHALRNNFITLALFNTPHRSLPLQSAAIYCAVARRLGVDAKPSNFPHHVYVVVQPPRDTSLDGRPQITGAEDSVMEQMHMDPWRSDQEVDTAQLRAHLRQMGIPDAQMNNSLGPVSVMDATHRAGRNITTSVVEARNRGRPQETNGDQRTSFVDVDRAWYSMLWSTMILGSMSNLPALQQRRRSCLPYLMEHYQTHQTEDIGLLERYIVPMLESYPEQSTLLDIIASARKADESNRLPCPRTAASADVKFKVGTHFMHRRYGYTGVIIGWDARCEAGEQWINQMRVHELPKGRDQPFYNVLADDKSVRYVAQENIEFEELPARDGLMEAAGRYFLRWDDDTKSFVSNIKEEYPDD